MGRSRASNGAFRGVRAGLARTLALWVMAGSGCAIYVAPPERPKPGAPAAPPSWARVLERFVDEQGRVDLAGIRADPADLDQEVGRIAWKGPQANPDLFPTRAARLAFYLNAYNALALHHAAHSGTLPESRSRFFSRARFMVGGELLSLDAIEERLLEVLAEPRAVFALCSLTRSSPRLPREPFSADAVDAQLDAAARSFLNEPRGARVDAAGRIILLSPILKWRRSEILEAAPCPKPCPAGDPLVAFVNRFREKPLPAGHYKVKYLPFDWTLHERRPPRSPGN